MRKQNATRTALALTSLMVMSACTAAVPPTTSEAAAAADREVGGVWRGGPGGAQGSGAGNERDTHGSRAGYGQGPRLSSEPQGSLTGDQESTLLHLAEEEKLAHDLYALAYEAYGLRIFDNISRAETRHEAAMVRLLTRYGLPDPTDESQPGVFRDTELQALYDTLSVRVLKSQTAALLVGKKVERLDIRDLKAAMQDAPQDVERVLGSLLRGSRNHLRAFTAWL